MAGVAAGAGWRPPASGGARARVGRAGEGAAAWGKLGKWERRPRGSFLWAREGGIETGRGGIGRRSGAPTRGGGGVNRRRFSRGEWGKWWRTWRGSCPRRWMRARVREGAGFCGDVNGNGGWGRP